MAGKVCSDNEAEALLRAMYDFAMRVLSPDEKPSPEELAILPAMISTLCQLSLP